MIVDNGARQPLEIADVFSGLAGVAGGFVSFIPNRRGRRADQAGVGLLNGVAVRLSPQKDSDSPFWTSRFEVIE